MKIAVLGGGISGLAAAARLLEYGHDITLFEKDAHLGGLCKTEYFDDYVFDIHGGHVFNSKYPEIKNWVFSLISQNLWQHSDRISLIEYHGKMINYPFELSLNELPVDEAAECLLNFIHCKRDPREKPQNFRDWLYWMFGKGITEKYMIPYNEKIWNRDLSTLCISWVDGKMPLPNDFDLIKSILDKNFKEQNMPHCTYYYPIRGGIQTLINAIADKIPQKITGRPVQKIERGFGHWIVDGQSFDKIINTIPLPEFAKIYSEMDSSIKQLIGQLQFNSLTTALFKYQKSHHSWIYYPTKEKGAHRMVFQGNFSKALPGSVALEKIGRCTLQEMIKGFDLSEKDCVHQSWTKYAYPVFDVKYDKNIEKIKKYFELIDVSLVGRFAEWKYYNMDTCIKRAFDCVESLNLHESTL